MKTVLQNVHAVVSDEKVVTVHPTESFISKQNLPNFEGISSHTAGSKVLCMHTVIIPPGHTAASHLHRGYETVIYILKGNVETRFGKGLKQVSVNGPGDFMFIPADVPHQPYNPSQTEEVVAIVARNDPNEQESVELYDPAQNI